MSSNAITRSATFSRTILLTVLEKGDNTMREDNDNNALYEAPDFSVADLEDTIAIDAGGSYWSYEGSGVG